MISYTPRLLYPRYLLKERHDRPQRYAGCFGNRKIPCFCRKPTHDSSVVQTVAQLMCLLIIDKKSRDVGYAIKTWTRPEGFRRLRLPHFPDSRHMKVVISSAVSTGHLYRQNTSLILISVKGCLYPRAIVRPEGLKCWIKI